MPTPTSPTIGYRVAAIATYADRILLHRAETDPFWSLPGGSIRPGESSPAALHREMQEELGLTIRIERLVWMLEYFFQHQGRPAHELGLYYAITFPTAPGIYHAASAFSGWEGDEHLTFQWFTWAEVVDLHVYPSLLKSHQVLPITPQHLVYHEPL